MEHEKVHQARCQKVGKLQYGMECVMPGPHACNEADAYKASQNAASKKLEGDAALTPEARLELRCYKKNADSQQQAFQKACDSWKSGGKKKGGTEK